MKIHKTIRFQLTLWYSLLFLIFNLFFILITNYVIGQHYKNRLPDFFEINRPQQFIMQFQNGELIDIQDTMEKTRQNDKAQIQKILYYSSALLVLLSFGGGYLIAGWMLRPIKKINKTTNEINSHNLDQQIEHEDTGDEISEMINNINRMIARLNKSFVLQKQFVENASHELKTPLSVIKLNLDLAGMENKNSYIDTALKSTNLMNKLIEDLLLLSLVDRDINLEDVNLSDILNDAVNQLNILAKNKNLNLSLKINGEAKFKGNKALLQRAFMNLIENAINYSKEKGKIDVALEQSKTEIIIKFIDNGIGIEQDKLDKVFERFYRVDRSRSRKSGGSGLGLAITKKIIELHKGSININSVFGLGSEITITFHI